MSFVKLLHCYFCRRVFSLADENFPVNLYDVMTEHNLDQLIWLCKSCKNAVDRRRCVALFPSKQRKKGKLAELMENVRVLTEEVSGNKSTVNVSNISADGEHSDSRYDNQASCDFISDTSLTDQLSSSTKPRNSKENKVVLPIIHSILNSINVADGQESRSKAIIKSVVDDLLKSHFLKNDEFCLLWNRFYYTGSAYNNLQTASPTEYDINLILQIPHHNLTPEILGRNSSYGRIKCEVSADPIIPLAVRNFVKSCSVGGYLHPRKILAWLQRQIDIVLRQQLKYPPGVANIRSSGSGLSQTIAIDTIWGYYINVDLVPVFEFECSSLSGTRILNALMKINEDPAKHSWFMIPKPCQGETEMSIAGDKFSWRLDFPNAENLLLHDKECAKNVIKILRHLLDKKKWKGLASYYMITVVLLSLINYPSKQHWSGKFLFKRLLDTMKKLKSHIENQYLPHFLTWENLFFKLNVEQGNNWSNHLQHVITSIESDPHSILKKFW